MIVTLLFSVNPDAAFAVTVLCLFPCSNLRRMTLDCLLCLSPFKPEEDDLGLLATPIPKSMIENELELMMDQDCILPTFQFSWHPALTLSGSLLAGVTVPCSPG